MSFIWKGVTQSDFEQMLTPVDIKDHSLIILVASVINSHFFFQFLSTYVWLEFDF